jgi:hypothetical protein
MVAASRDQSFGQSIAGEQQGFSRGAQCESSPGTTLQGAVALDRELLIKLLNMTESRHDGEVLSAVRKSNELLRRSQLSWSDLVGPTSAPRPAPERAKTYHHDFHDLRGSAMARDARPYRRPEAAHAAFGSRKPPIKSIPFLLRIPLLPLLLVTDHRRTGPERSKAARATAMFIAVSMYLLCFGLSVVVLREAFRF